MVKSLNQMPESIRPKSESPKVTGGPSIPSAQSPKPVAVEDQLDWEENRRRSPVSQWSLDALMFLLTLATTVLLIWGFWRAFR